MLRKDIAQVAELTAISIEQLFNCLNLFDKDGLIVRIERQAVFDKNTYILVFYGQTPDGRVAHVAHEVKNDI